MTAPKFTPGPWKFHAPESLEGLAFAEMSDGREIGWADGYAWNYLSKSDAALIAAAPELYAALVDVLSPSRSDCNDRACGECSVCKARNALGKASPHA